MNNPIGRPRDARIDGAVLDAAAELLMEVGYAEVTVAAVADRAGTSRPAVYRRWPGKAHLIHEATFRDSVTTGPSRTGSFAEDLRELVRRIAELLTTPLARIAVPGLIAEAATDPVLHRRILERFSAEGWRGLDADLAAAVESGELDTDVDTVVILEMIIGSALAATLIRGPDGLTADWVDRTARILLDGVRPADRPATS
ncbi:TetR/AcrR family transcriptional regulator [Actinomadura sp. WMMB 499]|uniref:TetR/AcrR family transcriptional regulator n=1 Tax=Actinomadura sp. WMMB 499 TaxID=1219491 RepID=UPI0012490B23|nr:TetR/AcrR family transcriptional regulator [Actinomadura sp. WMMB 499]QFG22245.1 TetR/AcrR family transcriptional regulator [Actinomadura sp. WMMB 499]